MRAPASSAAAVWLAPPDCTKPDENPASRFDDAHRRQVAAGVDLVVVLARQRARDADGLGGEHEQAERRPAAARASRRPRCPARRLRQRARHVADHVDAVRRPGSRAPDTTIAATTTIDIAGARGAKPLEREQRDDARQPDDRRHQLCVAESNARTSSSRSATPNSAGSWLADDHQPEPEQEPGHDRLGDEVRDRAEAEDAAEHQDDPGEDRERRRQRREARHVTVRERADGRRAERRGRRGRADDQRPRRAEQRVRR